ncbi:Hexuronate transporter [Paraburkholderia caffeinitolerans]|uniref:Hexuronate transporter n=2 Tax=Paraburkholderia TaxID=1822464 RepID=A0A6J5FEN2_9BURK|nr:MULTISPECIES: MFS transporter [Paraburkholderia]CAB3778393.1 Hexuronate transporter [Paraburkholderia caffeinitolerans]
MVNSAYRPGRAWSIAFLLTGLALVNFLDKIVLGMVAVPLMAELKMSAADFGVLAGSFFWLFSLSGVALSFLADRYPARWILLVLAFSWSVLQIPLVFAHGVMTFLVCRVVLGIAEGPTIAISMHALFKWFPNEKRSLPMAIFNQGAAVGLVLAGLLIPLVSKHWGWRTNFELLAIVGALWCLLWLCFGREGNLGAAPSATAGVGDQTAPDAAMSRLPYRRILTMPSVLILLLIGFAAYWSGALILTWLPAYLQMGLGFDAVTSGRLFSGVLLLTAPYTIALGWISDRMLARGASSRKARVNVINAAFLLGGVLLIGLTMIDMAPLAKVAVLGVATCLPTICFTFVPAILAELVPMVQRSSVMGIYLAVATSAGAISPVVVGRLVEHHHGIGAHGYQLGFAIGGGLLIVAALLSACYLHPERAHRRLTLASRGVA